MYSSSNTTPYGHDDYQIVDDYNGTVPAVDTFADETPGCVEQALDCTALPDACTNEVREEKLIQRQQKKMGENDTRNWLHRFVERERNLLIACVVLVVCLNLKYARYILYPFMIFSTWVHEMCHACAALLVGGSVKKIQIFKDGSGLAYTAVAGNWRRGWVASGGYPGTSVTGCILLLFRRTTLGPTIGTIGLGLIMTISCAVWVRNVWGFWVLLSEGLVLMLLGWKLPAHFLDSLFAFLAATCCLNAVESIHDLFAIEDYYVGGEEVTTSDAHTVAEKWGGDYRFWAILWLCMSAAFTTIGIIFAFNAKHNRLMGHKGTTSDDNNNNSVNNEIIDAEVNYAQNQTSAPPPSAPVWDSSMQTSENYSVNQQPANAPPKQKKKRNFFGFMKKKKNLKEPTLY
ncbi:MAG: hypothetical protein SGILL_001467 [Bacillariaceae sp.]